MADRTSLAVGENTLNKKTNEVFSYMFWVFTTTKKLPFFLVGKPFILFVHKKRKKDNKNIKIKKKCQEIPRWPTMAMP